jgi:hypothetical protein
VRAKDANPSNLEVLLALGVSHTNGMVAPRFHGLLSFIIVLKVVFILHDMVNTIQK